MSLNDKDYKETLFLPRTSFPMRANLPEREKEWLDRWENLNIYKKLRRGSSSRIDFVLHDGPPYANGNLHIGHALNKILKDFVVRSQQVLGKNSIYVPGWDCHGLPIEWKIEEKYREKGKTKEDIPINQLREDCRKFASDWIKVQKEEFKRLGVTGDWDNPYSTMDFSSEAVISEEFVKLVMKGVVYQGSKPVMWSPVEKTALAEAEIEYRDHRSKTIWVRFTIQSGELQGSDIIIWTTTPWTIPSNKAVAFNSSIEYGLYEIQEVQDESWAKPKNTIILAEKLAEETMGKSRVIKYKKLRKLKFDNLNKLILSHPFSNLEGSENFWNYSVPLVEADHVTDDAGTGFVHIAPSHGAEDFEVFLKRGWLSRMTNNVEDDSSFASNVPFFRGLQIFNKKGKEGEANRAVIDKLIEADKLIARGILEHSYPHSWRSRAPVIFRNTPQWFVSIDQDLNDGKDDFGETIRKRALHSIDNLVEWIPRTGRNRLHSMVATRPDWVLSRQRAWGVPLTCFIKKGLSPNDEDFILKDQILNTRIFEVLKKEGADAWFQEGSKERFLQGLYPPDEYEQVMDILDVWFDSGSTHAYVLRDRSDGKWPADLYLEGTDQHRGFFHSSLLQSCGTQGKAPYLGVLTHGFILDEKGFKMSKSLGNTVSPQQVIKQYGADILRLWVAQSDYTVDLRIGDEILKGVTDSYRKLRNTARFLLGNLSSYSNQADLEYDDLPDLEKYILHRVYEVDKRIRSSYEKYSFQTVFQIYFQFCTQDLSSFYFDIRKDVLYCDPLNSLKRRATLKVLDILFFRLTTWFSPILPFTMEEVYLERFPEEGNSVHLLDIPDNEEEWYNPSHVDHWEKIRKVRRVVTGAIEVLRQNKVIGSSLEACPTIYIKDKDLYDVIKLANMSEVCITSGISIELSRAKISTDCFMLDDVPDVGVICRPAEGNKCPRCWVLNIPSEDSKSDLCQRCQKAVI